MSNQTEYTSLIHNRVKFEEMLPCQIAPGVAIRRADITEIEHLRVLFSSIASRDYNPIKWYEYDYNFIGSPVQGQTIIEVPRFNEDAMSYFLVSAASISHLEEFECIANLTNTDIRTNALTLHHGSSASPGVLLDFYVHNPAWVAPQRITAEMLRDLTQLHSKYSTIAPRFPEIQRAAEMFLSLRHLPTHSDFRILGMFAIIEMLITHNPNGKDIGDSITHQMKSKVPLLSNRFRTPLDYKLHFGEIGLNKVWSSLYSYRSKLAHGSAVAFGSGELQLLKSQKNVQTFLLDVVRKLIRHALDEPQLYHDIRDC